MIADGAGRHRAGAPAVAPDAAPDVAPAALRIEHLSKRFGGAVALDDVSLDLRAGEIHGLVGQNGSGKSTLIKTLAGYHQPDSEWTLTVGDHTTRSGLRPGEALHLGINFVHQDLGVIPDLTVVENLLLLRMTADRAPFISWRRERRHAHDLFAAFGLNLDPGIKLSALRPVEQAELAIIRAVTQMRAARRSGAGAGVLVLDEATTFLDKAAQDSLHRLLRSIVADGAAVLFVSHDVNEVLGLADRISVLRDGRLIETMDSTGVGRDEIVNLIVGGTRAPAGDAPAPALASGGTSTPAGGAATTPAGGAATEPRFLEVTGLTGEHVRDVNFTARRGEILGFTGIVGSGWEFVLEHLYGARPTRHGRIRLDGRDIDLSRTTPPKSLAAGMVYVPADRLRDGIIATLTVQDNVMLPVLHRMSRRGLLRTRRMAQACGRLLRRQAVQPATPSLTMGALSGGNQQKAVLAKWLQLSPRVLLLNQPTQGVDVGARKLIYDIIRTAVADGAIVLYASGDWEEMEAVADRVIVFADGIACATLSGDEVSVERLAREAYRGTRRSADLGEAWTVVGT